MRQQFNLLRVVLACAILSAIAAFILMPTVSRNSHSRIDPMLHTIVTLQTAAMAYAQDHGQRFPEALSELVPNYVKKIENDKWGRPFIYEVKTDSNLVTITIGSIGPDGKPNTGDDVVFAVPDRLP